MDLDLFKGSINYKRKVFSLFRFSNLMKGIASKLEMSGMKPYLFLIFTLVLFSCSEDDGTNEVQLRLRNASEFQFEDATFNTVNFGDIEPGATTEYRVFRNQYAYGSVSITIEGEEYGWIPIDFVGESLLEDGNYTFIYFFDGTNKVLSDNLTKD